MTLEKEDKEIIESVVERIEKSKPLPPEFGKIIEEDFWDLVF